MKLARYQLTMQAYRNRTHPKKMESWVRHCRVEFNHVDVNSMGYEGIVMNSVKQTQASLRE